MTDSYEPFVSFNQTFEVEIPRASISPELIQEQFEEIEGWAKLNFVVQSFDINLLALRTLTVQENQEEPPPEPPEVDSETLFEESAVDKTVVEDHEEMEKFINMTSEPHWIDDVVEKRQKTVLQELFTKSESIGNLTFVSNIQVVVELYDSNYVDNSVQIEFNNFIDGSNDTPDFIDIDNKKITF